jgi:cell volume regulation protein A
MVLVAGALLAAGLLASLVAGRLRVPSLLLFLGIGMLAGSDGFGWLDFSDYELAQTVGILALALILYEGGLASGWQEIRPVFLPAFSLATVGTLITAVIVGFGASVLFDMSLLQGLLIGAIVSSTDGAAIFAVLRGSTLRRRLARTLEGEAGMNDPAGIALMIGMIELATHDDATVLVVGREFVVEMVVGAVFGMLGGRLLVPLLRRARLPSGSMYPILALTLAGALYGATSIAHGSGFLAVFLAGLLIGDARLPYKAEIERFQSSLAGLAELVVFVALGATVHLTELAVRDWVEGLVLVAVMAVAIRPLVVAVTLLGVRMSRGEKAFIAFAGLKGAVPVLLAAFAILGGVPDGQRIYDLVFIAVLVSVVAQGSLVPLVARRLGIRMNLRDQLPWELSVRVGSEPTGAHEYRVAPRSDADGAALGDLPLGDDAWVTLLVRDGDALQPSIEMRLRPDDRVLILADDPERLTLLRSTFAAG